MKTKYVLGFAFTANSALTRLALIGKTKPRWQAGKLNGVGGKIEPGEEAHDAMQREFREETGVDIEEGMWELFAKLKGEHFEIYCFRVFDDRVVNVRTTTEEKVQLLPVETWQRTFLSEPDIFIDNLGWLMALALNRAPSGTPVSAEILY